MSWDDMATPFVATMMGLPVERVAYRPRTGEPREIQAQVNRSPPELVPGSRRARSPAWHILVRNDENAGIPSDALDTGGDEMDMVERIGGSLKTRVVAAVLGHDSGMVLIELR